MRALRKNTIRLWYVYPLSESEKVELKDLNGNFTGDFINNYSEPVLIRISLYPTNGKILREQYGIVGDFDFVCSTNLELSKDGRLYENQPSEPSMDLYDYIIVEKAKSINVFNYGIKARL